MNRSLLRVVDSTGRWRLIAIALAVLGVVLVLLAGGSYLNPPVSQTTVTENSPVSVDTTTKARVVKNTSLLRTGEVVSGSSLYRLDAMPNATVATQVDASGVSLTDVSQRVRVRIVGKRKGSVFWRSVAVDTTASARPGGDAAELESRPIDVRRLRQRAIAVRRTFNNRGKVTAHLVVTTAGQTEAGESFAVKQQFPLRLGAKTYAIGTGSASATRELTTTETVTSPEPLRYAGPLGIAALVCLLLAVGAWRADRIGDPDRSAWDYALAANDDWISTGYLDTEASNYVRMTDLDDLVDVAIDSDRRVVHDEKKGVCFVLAGDTLYYSPRPESSWVPENDASIHRPEEWSDVPGSE